MFKLPDNGRLLPAVVFISLTGCGSIPNNVRELPAGAEIELVDVPFHAQDRNQCGPAALTMVLQASGTDITLDDVLHKVYIPARKGSLQLEMIAATRTSGRLPYLINKSLAALLAELNAGRPVVILQNLGVAALPRWHYAVVIGIDARRDRVILRSGAERRRETPIDLFLRTWARSDFWGMVAVRPGEMPTNADRQRYLAATADLEQAGRAAEAALAWEAALRRWPGDTTALFGFGNTRLALGDLVSAERAYRKVIAVNPALAVARNNLALTLAKQSRFDEAIVEIEQALTVNEDVELVRILIDTRTEILSMADSVGGQRP